MVSKTRLACHRGWPWRLRFCFILTGYLSPHNARSFLTPHSATAYFFKIKSHGVYGTYFEYLAMTYGPLTTWGVTLVGGIFQCESEDQPEFARLHRYKFSRGQ